MRRQRSDTKLLADCRAGRGGFEAFYLRHCTTVLAFHARRVAEPETAADLTAETFAAALLAIRDLDRALPPVPVAWLLTIAHNKLVDSYRREVVQDEARQRLRMQPLPLYDEDVRQVEEAAVEVDLLAEIGRWVTPAQLQALRARVLDERSYEEIAGELGCSATVIRMRVSRALKTLRHAMEAPGD